MYSDYKMYLQVIITGIAWRDGQCVCVCVCVFCCSVVSHWNIKIYLKILDFYYYTFTIVNLTVSLH